MNHDQATGYFDALGASTESRPPLPDLIAAGRTAERRKRRRTVGASVAAVALILGGGAVVQAVTDPDGNPAPSETGDLTPPSGTQYVGVRQVVLAVPDGWGNEICGRGMSAFPPDNLAFRSACVDGVAQSTVDLMAGTSPYAGTMAEEDVETDVIHGVDVEQSDFVCPPTAECTMPDAHVLTVPSQGVTIVWRGPILGQPLLDKMVDSIRLLPDARTAVPFLAPALLSGEAGNELIAAGLKFVESPTPELPTGRANQYGTDPKAGSVVDVGSTVTLLLAQRTVTNAVVEQARRIVDQYVAEHPREEVTSATVMTRTGKVRQPNTGKTCDSGRLLRIDLFGSFPDIAVGGGPGMDGEVTKVLLTADAESEKVCLISVQTGTALADPSATLLFGPSPETTQTTGMADVTIDVPAAWVDDSDACTQAFEGAIALHEPGPRGDRACGQVPSVFVMSSLTGAGRNLAASSPLADDRVNGIDVRVGSSCALNAACIYPNGTVMEVPAAGVVVLIASSPPDSADAQAIIDSLRFESSGPSRLNGTWEALLSGITGGDTTIDKHRDTSFTLTLADGQMHGDDGCNDFGADFTTVERDLVFGPVESTLVGCDSTADFVRVLGEVRHITGQGNEFHLHAANWGILVTIRRIDDE